MVTGVDMAGKRVLVTGGSGFIGTHLVDALQGSSAQVLNLDVKPPYYPRHQDLWRRTDICDGEDLERSVRAFEPSHVFHLAARTDMEGATVADYSTNTVGTENLLTILASLPGVERMVLTSTQFVCGPGVIPETEQTWAPHTVYGASKADMERFVRARDWPFVWTIVRPTNVWGPNHSRYPSEFWRVLHAGRYMHPGTQPVIRSYGYVGNVVYQMLRVAELPEEVVHRRVFYVGDPPIVLLEWVSEFSRALTGAEPRIVPRFVIRALGVLGDSLSLGGITFPITSSRYRSMTQDYRTPMEESLAVLGSGPFELQEGVRLTVDWLRDSEGWDIEPGHQPRD